MYRQFKQLLPEARGVSQFIVGMNIDVRRFSEFALRVESAEAIVFLKSIYAKILGEYFQDAPFFKPTGDGLLIVLPYAPETLHQTVGAAVERALALVEDFPRLTEGDPMVNFPVPEDLGIGMARGAASGLVAGDEVLDYSGRVLNLASRLMDLARPAGVVLDSSVGVELLPEELASRFARGDVTIRGIAEAAPLPIFYTPDRTELPAGPAALRRADAGG